MECEICGKKVQKLLKIEVEGTKMEVCHSCAAHGRVVEGIQKSTNLSQSLVFVKKQSAPSAELQLVDDYGKRIKSAREKLGMSCKDLALAIAEQESYLDRVEKQRTMPNESLIRKLEKYLKISLYEEAAVQPTQQEKRASSGRYLGDYLEDEK